MTSIWNLKVLHILLCLILTVILLALIAVSDMQFFRGNSYKLSVSFFPTLGFSDNSPVLNANNEQYGIIIDAGSSGSRIHVFKWKSKDVLNTISEIARKKITPGISHYITYEKPGTAAGDSLNELLKYAEDVVPDEFYKHTRISLKATAGMRLLKRKDQIKILHGVRNKLIASEFVFQFGNANVLGGTSEALFAWTTVNVGKKTVTNLSVINDPEDKNMEKTYAIIELGGASSQIVHPSKQIYEDRLGLRHLKLLYGKQSHPFCLYAVSRLHFGLHRTYDLLLELFLKTSYKHQNINDEAEDNSRSTRGDAFPCAFSGDPNSLNDFNNDKRIPVKSNYNLCKKLVKVLIRKMEEEDVSKLGHSKRQILFKIQKQNPVPYYALDNFAKLITIMAKSGLNLPNKWDELANEIVVTDINEIVKNGKLLCNNFNYTTYMNLIGNPKKVKLKRKACFGVVYMEILLKYVYNVVPSEKQPIIFAHQIDNKVDAGWTLGAMINDIYRYNEKLNFDETDWVEGKDLVNPLHG
jgi:hypothetical protein